MAWSGTQLTNRLECSVGREVDQMEWLVARCSNSNQSVPPVSVTSSSCNSVMRIHLFQYCKRIKKDSSPDKKLRAEAPTRIKKIQLRKKTCACEGKVNSKTGYGEKRSCAIHSGQLPSSTSPSRPWTSSLFIKVKKHNVRDRAKLRAHWMTTL